MEQIIPSWESSTLDSVEMLYTLTDYYFRQNQLVYICIYIGTNKSAKNPISDGEEYIVTIEETSKSGTGVAKIRGFVVFVNNSNPGERVKIRIKQLSRNHVVVTL
jgi:predicted RNA-binding protein with TRAM domain